MYRLIAIDSMKITPKAEDKVLKLAVYDVDFVSDEFKCTKEIPEEELDNNSWWYLHGKLENIVGYDKAYTINCFSAGYSKETLNCREWMGETVIQVGDPLTRQQMYVNGIIPIEIEGINEPCLGYFWTEDYNYSWIYEGKEYPRWKQRGLVCLASDLKGRKYAEKALKEKPWRL